MLLDHTSGKLVFVALSIRIYNSLFEPCMSPQCNTIASHYRPLSRVVWEVNTGLIKLLVKIRQPPRFFSSVQFHELTLIDSGLPLSSWRQSITNAACVECNIVTSHRRAAYLLRLARLHSPRRVILCLKDRLYWPPLNTQTPSPQPYHNQL